MRTDFHRRVAIACKRAGFDKLTFHDLRHICGSNLMMQGGVALAQSILGHKDIKMTVDTYGHLSPIYLRNQSQAIGLKQSGVPDSAIGEASDTILSGEVTYTTEKWYEGHKLKVLASLSEQILSINYEKQDSFSQHDWTVYFAKTQKLAKLVQSFCHQLTPNNKKGLTEKPVSP